MASLMVKNELPRIFKNADVPFWRYCSSLCLERQRKHQSGKPVTQSLQRFERGTTHTQSYSPKADSHIACRSHAAPMPCR